MYDLSLTEQFLKRIAEALENLNEKLIPVLAKIIGDEIEKKTKIRISSPGFPNAWEGEKSEQVPPQDVRLGYPSSTNGNSPSIPTDSKPLPKVVQTQNYVDVRECYNYSEKSYKLLGYDNKTAYIAKQHVIRTESIEGGGTRVIVSEKSAWVLTKLEWT